MGESSADSEQQNASTETDDDLFAQLRARIKEMSSDEGRQVDPKALAKKLDERARLLRGRLRQEEPVGPQVSFLAFRHGRQKYGISVSEIVEVQPLRDYCPVPGSPPFVPGVMNWRGTILALVDLVKLFELEESGLIDERTCVIVETAGRRIGILAGEVEELVTTPLSELKPLPELPGGVPPDWIVGVNDRSRLILQMDKILQDARLTSWRN